MTRYITITILILALFLLSCGSDSKSGPAEAFRLEGITIDGITDPDKFLDITPDAAIYLTFSDYIDEGTIAGNIRLADKADKTTAVTLVYDGKYTVAVKPVEALASYAAYRLLVYPGLKSGAGATVQTGKTFSITTGLDTSDKFPRISDDELLSLVQKQTFAYFWDFGHPVSGMARDRTTSGQTVTTGGTGFGVMAMTVAADRGFISRGEALGRIQAIVTFLGEKCTRYHGAFSHWVDGGTGATLPFSRYDDGADLVETALLLQGLLTARAYFDAGTPEESRLRNEITDLWKGVEWTWFQQGGKQALYWHWSPRYGWQINQKISGWNECLIVYVLAASSPTYPVEKTVYDQGWAGNGAIANGNVYYGHKLPLGSAYGGPLFFSHYSFLGLNPGILADRYADYMEQNRAHTLIHYEYCVDNPKKYKGYGADCWGLTACDGDTGYAAFSPENDKGVIAPTAALSAMPYTPEESMNALRFYYYKLGDRLWSDYGFYDAFNLSAGWFDNQHIAIDQGPVIVMIENYRTGLPWMLFMSDPEIKEGLRTLGFKSAGLW